MTPFYYGWLIAGVAGAANFSRVSSAVEVSSIFVPALVAEFGWSLALIASATTIGSIASAVAGPFVGRLLDRYGSRVVVPLGAFIVGLGCLTLAGIRTALLFVVVYAVVRAAGQSMVMFPNSVTVAQWFERKRGSATAMMSAISAAGLVVGLVGASVIIANAGVGPAWAALGVLALVLGVVPGLLFLARRPEDIGLRPDGAPVSPEPSSLRPSKGRPEAPAGSPDRSLAEPAMDAEAIGPSAQRVAEPGRDHTLAQALHTPALWAIVAVSFMVSGTMTGFSFHQVAYYIERGMQPGVGAAVVGVYAFGMAVGGVMWGWLADRVHVRVLLLAIYVTAAVLLALLLGVDSAWQAFPIGFVFGTLVGGAMSIPTLLVADYYGRSALGAISGVVYMSRALGLGAGPLVAGIFHDMTRSYELAFVSFIAVCLASAFLMAVMRRPARA